jgi:signal transduction histidine kinase
MKRSKILIVDDEEKNIKLLKGMLMSENYQIDTAVNGQDAFRRMAGIHPDLVLLDVMMPGISGFEVCRKLKQNEETKTIPIVMVTALREKEHRLKAMDAGADDFISKPVDQTELLIRVKSLLRIKSYHDELSKSYQEISAKNDKLLELEKIKEGLTHMIIHDLRNPLGAIVGFIDLILLDKQDLSQNQREILQNCMDSCQDLKEMIESMLDIYKMEEGQLQLDLKQTNLKDVIDEAINQFRPKAAEKQIALVFDKGIPIPVIQADRRLVKRVITNLLNNAIRHTPSCGTVTIAAEMPPDNGCLHIGVEDTGAGLAPEYHQKVFDKFEQVKLKKAGDTVGSCGLGLAFCKMAVEAHAGKIWVESEGNGKGATFRLTLPI